MFISDTTWAGCTSGIIASWHMVVHYHVVFSNVCECECACTVLTCYLLLTRSLGNALSTAPWFQLRLSHLPARSRCSCFHLPLYDCLYVAFLLVSLTLSVFLLTHAYTRGPALTTPLPSSYMNTHSLAHIHMLLLFFWLQFTSRWSSLPLRALLSTSSPSLLCLQDTVGRAPTFVMLSLFGATPTTKGWWGSLEEGWGGVRG